MTMGTSNSDDSSNARSNASKPRKRDDQADVELEEFLETLAGELKATTSSSSSSTSTTTTTPSPSTSQATSRSTIGAPTATTTTTTARPSRPRPSPSTTTSPIAPVALYPTSMNCRETFDSAFYCQSPGGQFLNVYRYGTLKDCGAHWKAFWFCMRVKSLGKDERERRIRQFHVDREDKYRTGPSSEDVWDLRTTPLTDAFQAREEQGEGRDEAGR